LKVDVEEQKLIKGMKRRSLSTGEGVGGRGRIEIQKLAT